MTGEAYAVERNGVLGNVGGEEADDVALAHAALIQRRSKLQIYNYQ